MKATKITWDLKYLFTRCEGYDQVDVYSLWSPTESLAESVLLTVPHGRSDIAKFVKYMLGKETYIRAESSARLKGIAARRADHGA